MTTPRKTTRHWSFRRLAALATLLALLIATAGIARADALDDAARAFENGDVDTASSRLLDWILADPEDPAALLRAVRLAARMKDLDLVERVQGRIELVMEEAEGPLLDLALGLAYHTLASERLAAGMQGPTLAMLFADAEAQAQRVLDTPFAAEGRRLLARVRWAQGDLDGALEVLGGTAPPASGTPARQELLRGRLLYDRAVTRGLGDDGRPTAAGDADLAAALGALGHVVAHLPADADDTERFDLWTTLAWTAHRRGEMGAAAFAYARAWETQPSSTLPRRGLESLFANLPEALAEALEALAAAPPARAWALEALAEARRRAGDVDGAAAAAARRAAMDVEDPEGWTAAGRMLLGLGQREEARAHLVQALRLDPGSDVAARLLDATARSFLADDAERARAIYEELLALRPKDPYVRNNYGFVLRETVTPHTTVDRNGIQTLVPDAPEEARRLLERCVEVYAEAAATIDDEADMDEKTAWVLAGIVNDYGLMLHYFADVQDPLEAERQYHRALAMTDHGFKDTYIPNLRRLYATVLPHRALSLYAAAQRARDAVLAEVPGEGGDFTLVPDEAKRQLAAQDVAALRAGVLERLREDAEADGDPWPPEADAR